MQKYCIFWCCIVLPLRFLHQLVELAFVHLFSQRLVVVVAFSLDVRDSLMGFLIRHIPFDITVCYCCCCCFFLLNFQQYHIIFFFFFIKNCAKQKMLHICVCVFMCVRTAYFCSCLLSFDFVERPTQHYPLVAKISKMNCTRIRCRDIVLSLFLKFSCGQQMRKTTKCYIYSLWNKIVFLFDFFYLSLARTLTLCLSLTIFGIFFYFHMHKLHFKYDFSVHFNIIAHTHQITRELSFECSFCTVRMLTATLLANSCAAATNSHHRII